ISAAGNTYFSNAVRGTGTLTASGTDWFNFTGSLKEFAGTFHLNTTGGMNLHSNTGDASNVCFVVSPNSDSLSLIDTGAGISVGMITGGKTDGSRSSRPSSGSGATTTLKVGNDTEYANHTWDGAFWENDANKKLSIEKVGSNTWTWTSGNHTFTGGLTVSEGVLELTSTANVRNSAVTVEDGGTLRNAGTVGKAITVNQGGTYEGIAGSTVSLVTLQEGGILTGNAAFNKDTLRLTDHSVLAFDLDALTSMSLSDVVFPDHLIVDVSIDDPTDAYNQTYNLFSVDSNILDSLDFLFSDDTSVVWATGYTNGNVWVRGSNPADVPEPASWILLLAAGGLMWRFHRRV
ncbi:MAG: PEP-CTERM sorting domain-containing protein, partial [Planctomycetia bacterium]|nr:PEP-CTERM sorting domain-containing protein [Planctomycetia bacterium]